MKSMIVLPGRAPRWARDQARYVAQFLAEDGRVTVVITAEHHSEVVLPGSSGQSTLLGNAPSGYPIWTGRLSAALGVRRRQHNVVVTLWDEANLALALCTAVVARLRREVVFVDDQCSRTPSDVSRRRRILRRSVDKVANVVIDDTLPLRENGQRRVAVAIARNDARFARHISEAIDGMADDTASSWRVILQADIEIADQVKLPTRRHELMTIEWGDLQQDLLMNCDVLLVAHGRDDDLAVSAVRTGASAVIIGQSVAERMFRRLDGVWLSKAEPSSVVVALEALTSYDRDGAASVTELRTHGDRVVRSLRRTELGAI